MQITLHGGPHDGRRITLDPAAAARRYLFVPDLVETPIRLDEAPITAARPPISVYQAQPWADGPTTGPGSRHTRIWTRWQYTGHQR